ncbi:MAG: hypothetical protein RLZ10_1863 [Bacteroidota bacterium]|jgi:hypothetical protein
MEIFGQITNCIANTLVLSFNIFLLLTNYHIYKAEFSSPTVSKNKEEATDDYFFPLEEIWDIDDINFSTDTELPQPNKVVTNYTYLKILRSEDD